MLSKTNTILIRVMVVLLVLVCLSTAMVTGRYARYYSAAGGEDSARVAKFDVVVSDTESQLASVLIQPGETAEKFFTVENKSEVAVALRFQVTSKYQNLPLEFLHPVNGVVAPGETKDVPLEITWPAKNNSSHYIGKVDLIEISVQAVQVD